METPRRAGAGSSASRLAAAPRPVRGRIAESNVILSPPLAASPEPHSLRLTRSLTGIGPVRAGLDGPPRPSPCCATRTQPSHSHSRRISRRRPLPLSPRPQGPFRRDRLHQWAPGALPQHRRQRIVNVTRAPTGRTVRSLVIAFRSFFSPCRPGTRLGAAPLAGIAPLSATAPLPCSAQIDYRSDRSDPTDCSASGS